MRSSVEACCQRRLKTSIVMRLPSRSDALFSPKALDSGSTGRKGWTVRRIKREDSPSTSLGQVFAPLKKDSQACGGSPILASNCWNAGSFRKLKNTGFPSTCGRPSACRS